MSAQFSLPSVLPSRPGMQDTTTTAQQIETGLARVTNPTEWVYYHQIAALLTKAQIEQLFSYVDTQVLLCSYLLQSFCSLLGQTAIVFSLHANGSCSIANKFILLRMTRTSPHGTSEIHVHGVHLLSTST